MMRWVQFRDGYRCDDSMGENPPLKINSIHCDEIFNSTIV